MGLTEAEREALEYIYDIVDHNRASRLSTAPVQVVVIESDYLATVVEALVRLDMAIMKHAEICKLWQLMEVNDADTD